MNEKASQLPPTIWITGLSASGKSTLGKNLFEQLAQSGVTNVVLLDGEDLRSRLNLKFGYTPDQRFEVIKNIVDIAKEHNRKQEIAIVSTISHKREMREFARNNLDNFYEVYLDCPVEVCSNRDYKGNYEKAFKGEYDCFVGVTEPYERSLTPELVINTAVTPPVEAAQRALEGIRTRIAPFVQTGVSRTLPAIVIAAGLGSRMGGFTEDFPKCLIPIAGRTILEHQLAAFNANGITDVTVIVGHQRNKVIGNRALPGSLRFIENDDYPNNNILGSLMYAEGQMDRGFIASYSDIVYTSAVVSKLLSAPGDIVAVVDTKWHTKYDGRTAHPPSEAEKAVVDGSGRIQKIGKTLDASDKDCGEFIGFLKCTAAGAEIFKKFFHRAKNEFVDGPFIRAQSFKKAYITDFLQYLIDNGQEVRAALIDSDWCEIDTEQDVERAKVLVKGFTKGDAS